MVIEEIGYKAKISGRGKLKVYGYNETPKFFCVLNIEGISEKKAMITVYDKNINEWGNLYTNDPIASISKGDTICFKTKIDVINNEWINIDSSTVKIIDDSGSKEWKRQRDEMRKKQKEVRDAEREEERKQKEEERNERKRLREELYKKYRQWYLKEYNLKSTGANILLMYKTLSEIKHSYSLLGKRGKKALFVGDGWEAPTGLHSNVFHGLNSRITNCVLVVVVNNDFGKIKEYKVITRDPQSGIETTSLQKGLNITKKGLEFISNFLLIK